MRKEEDCKPQEKFLIADELISDKTIQIWKNESKKRLKIENYLRIIRNKPAKMIGQVAIQRKLLILIYTLWKKNTEYDSNYIKKVASSTKDETTQDRILEENLL